MSFSFGTPSSAPATTGLVGGFSFGANKPATPGLGLTTSQPSTGLFGATPAASTSAFGATSTPAFGVAATPAFGVTSTPAFGATSTPAFGAASTSFGASTTPAFGATGTSAFGATTTPAFGATSTSFGAAGLGTGGLNFGTGTNTSAPSTGLTFGAPANSQPSLGLGGFAAPATSSTSGLWNFNTAASTAQNTSLLGGGMSIPTMFPTNIPKIAPIPVTQTFQLLPPMSRSTPYQVLGPFCRPAFDLSPIPANNTENPSYRIKSARKDLYPTIAPTCGAKLGTINLAGTQPATSVTQSVGLGGTSTAAGAIGAANTTTTGDGKSEPPKQTKLPNEIATSVDTFKEFVKKQKSLSSDIMRVSIKPLQKVAKDAEELLRAVLSLSAEVGKARAQSRRLRGAGATALAAADTASRDMPYSEYDAFAPPAYVKELISELEQQLLTFRRQMDVADKQMQASPRLLSEQELTLGIRRMHESLVALAGRLQNVHSQVEAQKEQYLNLRKYVLKDSTDVFENQSPNNSLDQILRDAEGVKRKNKLGLTDGITSAVLSDPRAALGNIHQLAGPTPFTYLGTNLTNFPGAETPGSTWQPQQQTNLSSSLNTSGFGTFGAADASSGFQLQKPPGKRTKQ